MNNKQLALVPPPHLLKGPEPNHQNPLLVKLVDICDYFTNEKISHDSDWYRRQNHFNELLKAISSGDIQLSVQLIEEGKTKFGATRIMGYKPNLWRSERYYTLLVNLYDAQVLKESNFKVMPRDVKGSDLDKYLNNSYFYGSKSLFSNKDKATVTYDDAVFLSNKFLDFFSIPDDYVPPPALPPAVGPVASEQGQLLPVNRANSSLSEQTQRKMRGMSDLEREMCELSQDTLRNEFERQQVTKKWEELQKKFQPGSKTIAPITPNLPAVSHYNLDDDHALSAFLETTLNTGGLHSALPAPSHYLHGNNPNGFMAPSPVAVAPAPAVHHLQPTIYPPESGIQWNHINYQ